MFNQKFFQTTNSLALLNKKSQNPKILGHHFNKDWNWNEGLFLKSGVEVPNLTSLLRRHEKWIARIRYWT